MVSEKVLFFACTDPEYTKYKSGMWFKCKGEKHSVSKVRTLAPIDIDKVNSINECVEQICTESRMEQGIDVLREQGLEIDIKNMGPYLKWLASDCIKEELDTIIASNLEPKNVGKAISNKGRVWYLKYLSANV